MNVDRRALRNADVDVRDADKYTNIAILQSLSPLDLIEIARRSVIDGRPQQMPQVLNIGAMRGLAAIGDLPELCVNLARKRRFESIVEHRLMCPFGQPATRSMIVHFFLVFPASWRLRGETYLK